MPSLPQEAHYYQLASLAAAAHDAHAAPEPLTASALRAGVGAALAADAPLRAALDVVLACAFGGAVRGGRATARALRGEALPPAIPPRSAAGDVTLREAAFCPLTPQPKHQARDEALYVGFRQEIRFAGSTHTEAFEAKHECHLLHEGGTLSYDHRAYGVAAGARHHVKAAHVWRHHCVASLPPRPASLRAAALVCLHSADALAWALELCGFRGVRVVVHAHAAAPAAGPAAGSPARRVGELPPRGNSAGSLLAAAPAAAAAAASAAASALSPRAGAAGAAPADPFAEPEPVFANVRLTVSLGL